VDKRAQWIQTYNLHLHQVACVQILTILFIFFILSPLIFSFFLLFGCCFVLIFEQLLNKTGGQTRLCILLNFYAIGKKKNRTTRKFEFHRLIVSETITLEVWRQTTCVRFKQYFTY